MIDVEAYIFDAAHDEVAPLCAKNGFKSVHTPNPTCFPTVTLFEMGNRTDYGKKSTQEEEDFAVLSYEAHVYATSKAECRKVFKTLDDRLLTLNMTRISGDYKPGTTNQKVHEFVARYRVHVDQEGTLYRKT